MVRKCLLKNKKKNRNRLCLILIDNYENFRLLRKLLVITCYNKNYIFDSTLVIVNARVDNDSTFIFGQIFLTVFISLLKD